MVIPYKNLSHEEPFNFRGRVIYKLEISDPSPNQQKLDQLQSNIDHQLSEKTGKKVEAILAKIDGLNDKKLEELKKLVTELAKIEKRRVEGRIDAKGEAVLIKGLLERFEDLDLSEHDIKALAILTRSAEERLQLREAMTKTFVPIFLRRTENQQRVAMDEVATEFNQGKEYRIDFHDDDLTQAQRNIAEQGFGLHNLLPDNVIKVLVTKKKGGPEIETHKREDGKFIDERGKRIYVYDQYLVKVLETESSAAVAEGNLDEELEGALAMGPEASSKPSPDDRDTKRGGTAASPTGSDADRLDAWMTAPAPTVGSHPRRVVEPAPPSAPLTPLQHQARVINEIAERSARQRENSNLERALGKEKPANLAVDELKGRTKAILPAELKDYKREDWNEKILSLHHGDMVFKQLSILKYMAGEKTEAAMLGKILSNLSSLNFKRGKISPNEITRAVFGSTKSYKSIKEDFYKAEKEVKVIQIMQAVMEAEKDNLTGKNVPGYLTTKALAEVKDKMPGSERIVHQFSQDMYAGTTELTIEQKLAANRNMSVAPGENVYYGRNPGRTNVKETWMQYELYADFLVATNRLMEHIPLLSESAPEVEVEYIGAPEADMSINYAKDSIAGVFNPEADAPRTHRNWLQRLFRPNREGNPLTMQSLDSRYNKSDELARAMSDRTAYQQLLNEVVEMSPEGKLEANLQLLADRLNDLRNMGLYIAIRARDENDFMARYEAATPPGQRLADGEEITVERLKEGYLPELEAEIIRIGMRKHQEFRFIRQGQIHEEMSETVQSVIDTFSGTTKDDLTTLASKIEFTPDEIREMGTKINEVNAGMVSTMLRIQREKQYDAAGNLEDTDLETLLGVGYTQEVPILETPEGSITYKPGFNGNIAVREFGFHNKLAAAGKAGRFGWEVGAGAHFGTESGASLGTSIAFSVDLGKYSQITLGAHASAGTNLINRFSLVSMGISISRNMEAVLTKRVVEKSQERMDAMKEGEANLNRDLDHYYAGEGKVLNEEQRAEFRAALIRSYKEDMRDEAVENLRKVQFLGAGIEYIPCVGAFGIPIPWVRVGIHGENSEFVEYATPARLPEGITDTLIENYIRNNPQISTPRSIIKSAAISGDITLTEGGQRTIVEGRRMEIDYARERLDLTNQDLAEHSVQLKLDRNMLRLDVAEVDGIVNVYTHTGSRVETTVIQDEKSGDSYVYLNLAQDQSFSLRRVDTYYPFAENGATHHVDIFLSDNIHVDNDTIKESTKDKLTYRKSDYDRTQTAAKEVILTSEVKSSSSFMSLDEMAAAGVEIEDFIDIKDTAERETAHAEMMEALGMRVPERIDKDEIERKAKAFVIEENDPEMYIKMHDDPEYYKKIIDAYKAFTGKTTLSNEETSYAVQQILIESRPEAYKDVEAFITHVIGWNTASLAKALEEQGVEASQATKISGKIMTFYADSLRALEAGEEVSRTTIPESSVVHTHIGREATGAFMEFLHATGDNEQLVQAIDMDPTALAKRPPEGPGLTPAEITEFFFAKTQEMEPLDRTNPNSMIHSQLGLAVLDMADLIWGADITRKMTEIVQGKYEKDSDIPRNLRSTWKLLSETLMTIAKTGVFESKGIRIEKDSNAKMGFIEECRNFTTTMHEGIRVFVRLESLTQAASAEVIHYLESRLNVRFTEGGLAAGVMLEETETHKGKHPSEKGTSGDVIEGQVEPIEIRATPLDNPAGIGSGGTPT